MATANMSRDIKTIMNLIRLEFKDLGYDVSFTRFNKQAAKDWQAQRIRAGMFEKNKLSPEQKATIVKTYLGGEGVNATARIHGVGATTVKRVVEAAGHTIRKQSRMTPEVKAEVAKRHAEGWTCADIHRYGTVGGVSLTAVTRHVKAIREGRA